MADLLRFPPGRQRMVSRTAAVVRAIHNGWLFHARPADIEPCGPAALTDGGSTMRIPQLARMQADLAGALTR